MNVLFTLSTPAGTYSATGYWEDKTNYDFDYPEDFEAKEIARFLEADHTPEGDRIKFGWVIQCKLVISCGETGLDVWTKEIVVRG